MFEKLEALSQALGPINLDDAKLVADAVDRRLRDLLGAASIRTYWRSETETGVAFTPVTFIKDPELDDPETFHLEESSTGVLSWSFKNKKSIWLENIKKKEKSKGMKIENSEDVIPSEDLWFRYDPDSVLILPFVTANRVRGLYVIDLTESDIFNQKLVDMITRLKNSVGKVLTIADETETNLKIRKEAVKSFLDSIRDYKFSDSWRRESYRTCFIARPFRDEFALVENNLSKILEKEKVRATSYNPRDGKLYVVDEIKKQIDEAHFCVADVTDSNPNVLTEVGMMMMSGKQILLLRQKDDESSWPFDINQYHIYNYVVDNKSNEIKVLNPTGDEYQNLSDVLKGVIRQVSEDEQFRNASEWHP